MHVAHAVRDVERHGTRRTGRGRRARKAGSSQSRRGHDHERRVGLIARRRRDDDVRPRLQSGESEVRVVQRSGDRERRGRKRVHCRVGLCQGHHDRRPARVRDVDVVLGRRPVLAASDPVGRERDVQLRLHHGVAHAVGPVSGCGDDDARRSGADRRDASRVRVVIPRCNGVGRCHRDHARIGTGVRDDERVRAIVPGAEAVRRVHGER